MNNPFDSLGLMPELSRAVAELGYEAPTPVQVQAIPLVLSGRDLMAAAQTGTGKTAGFALPILQKIAQGERRAPSCRPVCLTLAPTRELAAQIEESFRLYAKHLDVPSAVVFGGVGLQPQIDRLARGVDVLVATPGRLLDLVGQKAVFLTDVRYLVLDEADRMLDMGFIHDIRRILALIPTQRQSLMFSATFSEDIRKLASTFLRDPAEVAIARNQDAALVEQEFLSVAKARRRELLRDIILNNHVEQALVFTRMKHEANRLAQQLVKDGIHAAAIHGNKSQGARTKALGGFKAHEIRVLVATDLAARGLDIEQLPLVVNYELPAAPEDYVHRIGRTGRAGVPGHAISFVIPDDEDNLKAIAKLLRRTLSPKPAQGYEGPAPAALAADDAQAERDYAESLRRQSESRARTATKPAPKPAPAAKPAAKKAAKPAGAKPAAANPAKAKPAARSTAKPAATPKAPKRAPLAPASLSAPKPWGQRNSHGRRPFGDSRVRADVHAVAKPSAPRGAAVRSNIPEGLMSRLIRHR